MRRTAFYLSILVLSLGFAMASYGDAVVDDCSAYSGAPGTDLAEALASSPAGGDPAVNEITFACSGTIVVPSNSIVGGASISIDATGQLVTLSGNNTNNIFVVLGGTLSLTNLTVSNGFATNAGALAVQGVGPNAGMLTLIDVTVSNNTATSLGGGIVVSTNGALLARGTTLSGNSATTGAAVGVDDTGTATLINTTISNNTGGTAIDSSLSNASVTLINATVTNNPTTVAAVRARNSGNIALANTIVANQATGPDCIVASSGAITSIGNNLDSDGSCNLVAGGDKPNNPNANLGPLAANGGPTQTHALLPGSDALDMGNDTVCAAAPAGAGGVDQRGVTRPQFAACDIGAFELEEPPPPVPAASLPALAALAALLGLGLSRRAAAR